MTKNGYTTHVMITQAGVSKRLESAREKRRRLKRTEENQIKIKEQ
jgi:hypothetical protein